MSITSLEELTNLQYTQAGQGGQYPNVPNNTEIDVLDPESSDSWQG